MPSQMYAHVHTKPWAAQLPHMPLDDSASYEANAAAIGSWLLERRPAFEAAAATSWPEDAAGVSRRLDDLLQDLEHADRDYELEDALDRIYDLADYVRVFLLPPSA